MYKSLHEDLGKIWTYIAAVTQVATGHNNGKIQVQERQLASCERLFVEVEELPVNEGTKSVLPENVFSAFGAGLVSYFTPHYA